MATLASGPVGPVSSHPSSGTRPPSGDRATYLAFVVFMTVLLLGTVAALLSLLML